MSLGRFEITVAGHDQFVFAKRQIEAGILQKTVCDVVG
ncbi:hypothetical protein BSIN_3262 [Burkholderia singularis]|uniref:Uncharacterized protein n=1 Tax=Burkholderia singularis TaxID=1503053 RepID=A0A238H4C1_9BURK|nr:hypothetical protein BSIN_3262 [Burkholderia singularis]